MSVKKDGHIHSQFCHHGSRQSTDKSIRQAIKLGFGEISVTEHAPLPDGYIKDPVIFSEHNLTPDEIEPYISHVEALKTEFSRQIKVNTGFEFDYLPDKTDITFNQISELGKYCDDMLLSVHYVLVNGKPELLDYSSDLFKEKLILPLGSPYQVYISYLTEYLNLIKFAGSLPFKARLSHPMLVWKYCGALPLTEEEQKDVEQFFITKIIPEIRKYDLEVDYNVAGIDVPKCGKPYLSNAMFQACRQKGITLVYGSDAHSAEKIGRYYHRYEEQLAKK